MTHLAPYIGFNRKTEEALEFYAKIFNGRTEIQYVKDAPMQVDMPEHLVFHSALIVDDKVLMMASDMLSPDQTFDRGNAMSLALMPSEEADANKFFESLKQDGTVIFDLGTSEWGSLYGQVTDKYGLTWMIDCQPAQAA